MKKTACAVLAVFFLALVSAGRHQKPRVPPPPLRVEAPTLQPSPAHVWFPGLLEMEGHQITSGSKAAGRWQARTRPGCPAHGSRRAATGSGSRQMAKIAKDRAEGRKKWGIDISLRRLYSRAGRFPLPRTMVPVSARRSVASYREKIVDEIVRALGRRALGDGRRLIGSAVPPPRRTLRRRHRRAEERALSEGLPGAARRHPLRFRLRPAVRGAERIPGDGPLIIASNHPGLTTRWPSWRRSQDRPHGRHLGRRFALRALAAAANYFIYAPLSTAGRTRALRGAIRHLEGGGSLLIYPHTEVEPGPRGATRSPGSSGRTGRRASRSWMPPASPGPACKWPRQRRFSCRRFLDSPIVKVRRDAAEAPEVAEFLQVSWQMSIPRSVRPRLNLSFAAAGRAARPSSRPHDARRDRDRARLLETHMAAVRDRTPDAAS